MARMTRWHGLGLGVGLSIYALYILGEGSAQQGLWPRVEHGFEVVGDRLHLILGGQPSDRRPRGLGAGAVTGNGQPPLADGTTGVVAWDGQSLSGQTADVQKLFRDTHGAQAARVWATQHNNHLRKLGWTGPGRRPAKDPAAP